MKGDLELYRIFYVVAKHLHMSKASSELFISQPAVSQAIKKLESEIDTILFHRSNKGLKLTDEGKMIFNYVRPAIELFSSAENELTNFKELKVGKVRIGISTTLSKIVLLDALEKFHFDYPSISIDITNDLTSNLIDRLKNGLLDFVILNEGSDIPDELCTSVIKTIEHCFVANTSFFDSLRDKELSIKELNNFPLILQKNEANTRQFLNMIALDNKVLLKPYLEVVSSELVIEFSRIGLGIGFAIKDFVINDLNDKLFEIKLKEKLPLSNVVLAVNNNIILTSAAKKFISYLE